jgi:hypothetical protein
MSKYYLVTNYPEIVDTKGIVGISTYNIAEQERAGVDIEFRVSGFQCGKPLVSTLRPHLDWTRHGEILPVTCHIRGWVADPAVADALRKTMPDCVQLFETESESETLQGLWILNFTKTLDCLDREHSDFQYAAHSPDRGLMLRSVRFKEHLVTERDQVFYVKGLGYHLFCTARGRENLMKVGFDKRFFTDDYF